MCWLLSWLHPQVLRQHLADPAMFRRYRPSHFRRTESELSPKTQEYSGGKPLAKMFMGRFSLLRSCRDACTDRPDGFIGNNDLSGFSSETPAKPPSICRSSTSSVWPDWRSLSNSPTQSTPATRQPRRSDLPIDDRVRLAHHVASLAVAQNHVATTAILQHVDGNFACKCTRSFKIGILSTQVNSTAGHLLTNSQQIRVWRANQHLNTSFCLRNNLQPTLPPEQPLTGELYSSSNYRRSKNVA
jgi:hypothetical protein